MGKGSKNELSRIACNCLQFENHNELVCGGENYYE